MSQPFGLTIGWHRRVGVTLTEVLVAIFIMGIGLLSLLVLFPLGALQMAQAIRDDRCTHAAMNARALANIMIPFGNNTSCTLKDDPYTVAPYYKPPASPAPPDSPSYPVYIDPLGALITGTTGSAITGATLISGQQLYNYPPSNAPLGGVIPRVCPSFINLPGVYQGVSGTYPYQDLERWCIMTDDIQFQENGKPNLTSGFVQREDRYSWAWFCRQTRPFSISSTSPTPTPLAVEITVVVYDRRPLTLGPKATIGTSQFFFPAGETVCTGSFVYGLNTVTLTWSGTAPSLRPGTWILDATLSTPAGKPPTGNYSKPNGYFYRVVNVQSLSTTGATVELHMPARATSGGNGIAVVMENVAEVYEKGPITAQ